MTDLLQLGAAWLSDRLQDSASASVVYSDGTNTVTLNAEIGQPAVLAQKDGKAIRFVNVHKAQDFIVARGDLVNASNVAITPDKGHTITRTVGGKVCTFTVLPLGEEPCWTWSDPDRTSIRIHTKITGEANA